MADITIFDPATIRDVSTFEDPKHYAGGEILPVNGRRCRQWAITNERPAELRGPGSRWSSVISRRHQTSVHARLAGRSFARYGYAVVFAGVPREHGCRCRG
jgi:hypothetical protein